MSTQVTVPESSIETRYRQMLADYDGWAIRFKAVLFWLWSASMFLTWVPLLLAVVAMWFPLPAAVADPLLWYILPVAGVVNAIITFFQAFFVFRSSWLRNRTAAERLRGVAMRFRAGVAPFNGPDAEKQLDHVLDDVRQEASDRPVAGTGEESARLLPWWWHLCFEPLPPELRTLPAHAPDVGLYPRLADEPVEAAELVIVEQRLRHQRRWHFLRAQLYARIYLGLQAGIVLLGVVSGIYGLCLGRAFGLYAFTTSCTLFLVAWRELLGYASIGLRYYRLQRTLGRIEASYRAHVQRYGAQATPADRLDWLRTVAVQVEQTLASDFEVWRIGRDSLGTTTVS
jgi:hypothetical protein